ncbi:MAG: uroporphyrinogen-III C-methyltransferase [Actinomycetota bacterium]|nr:uroporphyrinogen-III C-methyltransferase [Actinomycetota bacterium]
MSFGGPPALPGTVHLVGAGPGDPGLLTLRGARLLQTCTLVAWDRLVASELLDLVPPRALRFEVGKRCGNETWSQEEINRLLVDAARSGHAVVRLKGGDPFVLGRGGEEAAACVAAGLPFEVVPGVTSAVAAPAAADIPVTHRGLAAGFAVITGHEDPSKRHSQVDWGAVAAFPGTLVVLMGLGRLSRIADLLIAHGRDSNTPAAAVRWGTTKQQEVVEASLGELAEAVANHGLQPPVTIVVGEVVAMRAVLAATPALVGAA